MKKKTVKKLALSRETLRDLEKGKLQEAVGATGGGNPASGCLVTCDSVYVCQPTYTEYRCPV